MRIALSPEAVADLERLHRFLVDKDPRAAIRASTTLADAIDGLMQFPERGRASPQPDHRELVVPFGKSAYVVRYKYRADVPVGVDRAGLARARGAWVNGVARGSGCPVVET